MIEAVYLGVLPVGAARYPDAGLAALVGTALAVRADGAESAVYLVAAALAAGAIGDWTSAFQRRWNGRTAAGVKARVAAGDFSAPGRAIGVALSRGALIGAAAAVGSVGLGMAGLELVRGTVWAGPTSRESLRLAALAAVVVSGGRLFLERRAARLACLTGLVVAGGLAWWSGLGAGP